MASHLMSDVELRRNLKAFGVNVGPITDSTRAVYLKKLSKLQSETPTNSEVSPGKVTPSRKLIGFSSDESDPDSTVNLKDSKTRRRKTARSSVENSDKSVGKRHTRASLPNLVNAFKKPEDVSSSSGKTRLKYGLNLARSEIGRSVRTKDFESSDTDDDRNSSFPSRSRSPPISKSSESGKRDSPPKSILSRTFTRSVPSYPRSSTPIEQPSSHMDSTYDSVAPMKDSILNHTSSIYRRHLEKLDAQRKLEAEFPTEEVPSRSYMTNISYVIVFVTGLFFVALALMYLVAVQHDKLVGFHNVASLNVSSDDNLLLCEPGSESKLQDCYKEAQVMVALKYISRLDSLLRKEAGDSKCQTGYKGTGKLSRTDAVLLLEKSFSEPRTVVGIHLKVAIHLISVNPHWGIVLYDAGMLETTIPEDVHWLESKHPHMSLFCRIWRVLALLVNRIILAVFAVLFVAIISSIVRYRWQQQTKERQDMYKLVEQIIGVLKDHHIASQEGKLKPYIAIPHVRDMLIPIQERKTKEKLWDMAVQFINDNESRVRQEHQTVAGEDFLVWRWLPVMTNSKMSPNGKKVWQGQAFENRDTGMNAMVYCPTQCLKIRNMFEKDSECCKCTNAIHKSIEKCTEPPWIHSSETMANWEEYIRNAILEKCSPCNEILHIAIDKSSREGCVYIKCTRPEAAGRVYKSLHGWWFDGKLVTVKYLRVERYHERFPESRDAHEPLRPSNDQCLSLSEPFYKSTLEIT